MRQAMAGGSHFIWIPLLLSCIVQASDNTHVQHAETVLVKNGGISELDKILSRIPITLPDGIDPKNVNVTSITIKSCSGMKEQLALLNRQLQQTTLHNSQLDEEAFGLRREVRQLRLKLATCTSTTSTITISYQTQLQNKVKEELEKFDSDTFLVLKILALTREVKTLENRIKLAANSSEITTGPTELQRELQEKVAELNAKQQQIEGTRTNSELILQIISLQNQIWDVEQEVSRRGETGLQHNSKIIALQQQLDRKISELQRKEDETSSVLELTAVSSKIAAIEKLITFHTEKSSTSAADYQRQIKEKTDLLKKKILQLNRDERNTDLTNEILTLQAEMLHIRQIMSSSKTLSDARLKELKSHLDAEKRRQENLEKQLGEVEPGQSQQILNIITLMKELRELNNDEQQQTTPINQLSRLQTLLQAKERDYAKAQADIKELQGKLELKSKECSGLEERYANVKTEFEQKIAELNRTGDSKAALVLNVINLHDELRTLTDLISRTQDPDSLSELQKQLEEKQEQLHSMNAQIKELIANPKIILTIIELQSEIWDLQNKGTNETTSDRIKELQSRVDSLISDIDGKGNKNTKLMLKIMTLQSRVEQLQKQLADLDVLRTSQVTELGYDLGAKKKELQNYVNELHEKNETNTGLILTVTNLRNQLRNLEEERRNDNTTSYLTITQLQEQLRAKRVTYSRDQAEIKTLKNLLQAEQKACELTQAQVTDLQSKLKLKSKECSSFEKRYTETKTELEQKIVELDRAGDSKAALILTVINLHDELKSLTDLISTTEEPEKIVELQRQLEEKQEELKSKTADIQRVIADPKIILTIIELQNEIWDLQNKGTNETANKRIKELQSRVDSLTSDTDEKGNENTKLMLRIMMLQNQVEQMQRQLSDVNSVKSTQVTQLENDLDTKKNELQRYVNELKEKNQENAELILSITGLNNQLRQLQEEKQNEGQKTSASITKLREQLKIKAEEHSRDQDTIKALESKLNQTEAQCSSHEQEIKKLQSDLDENMKKLESESDSVTTLALQVSTLTMQLEELQKQLQKTESKAKIKELQAEIEEKNKELAKKTEELKTRSTQPQRLLQIITIQTEIEKYMNAAANDTDYVRITALQDHLNYLVEGIQDEKDENTKLVFQLLTQQDEIARLKKQEDNQRQALLDKIKALEDELDDVRRQIAEKSQLLESHDMRIPNLSAEIIALHQRIKPLEDEISTLNETYAENMAELQARLTLTQKQLQDSELRLKDTDAKNFNSIMEIADLRAQLKKAQKKASKAAEKNINDLELQLQLQQKANKKLEITNRDLQQEVKELKMCCNEANTHCEDLKRQLQQSQEDADRLQRQLRERDAAFKQLQQDFKDKTEENEKLQSENSNKPSANLQQQLQEKDALVKQLQQQVDQRTADNHRLQDDYDNLQNEKNDLESRVQDLQDKLTDVEDKTIHISKMTFDPNTAHPRIYLSTDKTEMSTTEEILVRDNPNRFDVVLAALGKSGFSSGRHYWEVSVAGKLCYHIGMSSESAPRKGSFPFSPTNGYWTIVMNKQGQHRALDKRPVSISITTQPLQLGVLLDYKAGQISFYDSGARTHMYTFVGQKFTDKIHPFINYCVDEVENPAPIVLLNPGSADWIK
ncbi:myosin heavy chain, cardiac muscle isoform isoform X1 [Seriola aureovittata]|uniref:myosin heavy chain, cardiac muscle isoform isoform X1 n=1 Tax=Seriola aureovittata TaxID=2871759 RepID=UPI0024BE05AA|nr:myosin heavy chain, cardiac muscle isoform isoform X1 [Seriola aureovittata]